MKKKDGRYNKSTLGTAGDGISNADKDWHAYLAKATPLLQNMQNKIVTPAPFFAAS